MYIQTIRTDYARLKTNACSVRKPSSKVLRNIVRKRDIFHTHKRLVHVMVTQVFRSQTSIFICRVIDCPAFDIQSTATVCQFNGVCSRIECTVCSDMRIHHERQREVFISELISPRQVETGSFVLLEHFILVIQYSIAILVYIFEVTRLISIFGRFFLFSKLPYAITFVIPDLVGS